MMRLTDLLPRTAVYALFLAVVTLVAVPPGAEAQVELAESWRLEQALDMPESVVYDGQQDVLYVTSIVGNPSEKDGEGYLTKVSMDGQVVAERWVDGLHAPKGIAVHGGHVYVADIDVLVEIDAATGEIIERHAAPGAGFLNDVTVDDRGNVYVSDSNTSRVYRLNEGDLSVWIEGDNITAPNGLYAEEEHLIAAACAFDVEEPGSRRHFQNISYQDQSIEIPTGNAPMGNIDGIKPDGRGGYFITEWGPGTLSHYTPGEGVQLLRELGQGAADLEYVVEENTLVVPVMMSHTLIAYRVR